MRRALPRIEWGTNGKISDSLRPGKGTEGRSCPDILRSCCLLALKVKNHQIPERELCGGHVTPTPPSMDGDADARKGKGEPKFTQRVGG